MNPDGTGQAQLTTGADLDPVWSPDGQRVAFVRGRAAVYVVNANGTGETPVTSPVPNEVATPTWSPDGQRIAYTVHAGGQSDIWVVNVDGSNPTQITDTAADETDLTWSPDGTRIAYTVNASGFTIRPDGSDPRFLPFPDPEVYQQDWSPDGSRMVFMTLYDCDGDTCADIVTRRLDGTRRDPRDRQRPGLQRCTFDRPSWSPDGARIVLGTGGQIFTDQPEWHGLRQHGRSRRRSGLATAPGRHARAHTSGRRGRHRSASRSCRPPSPAPPRTAATDRRLPSAPAVRPSPLRLT